MNYKYFMGITVLIIVTACHRHTIATSSSYAGTTAVTASGQPMLLGHCPLSMLQAHPYNAWYDTMYAPYQPDQTTIAQLQPLLQHKTVEVFLGTWCGDSRREVPRLVKLLQAARFDTAGLVLIFTSNAPDAYKQSPQHEEQNKFIHRVPTILVYDGPKELGRIVETPVVSLEKDLLAIVSGKTYTPRYTAASFWHKEVHDHNTPMTRARLQELATVIKPMCKNASEMNSLGYVLLGQKNFAEAINLFTLNTLLYPDQANTYDSLAEAYAITGNKEKARLYYGKVLELKPGDANAVKQLTTLQ